MNVDYDKILDTISTFMKFDGDYPFDMNSGNQCDKLWTDSIRELWYVTGCKEANVEFEGYLLVYKYGVEDIVCYAIGDDIRGTRVILAKNYKFHDEIIQDEVFEEFMMACEKSDPKCFELIKKLKEYK